MDIRLQNIIAELSDLELASLVCLIAREHCIIRAPSKSLDLLQQELEHSAWNTFGLRHATLSCSAETRLEEFSALVVDEAHAEGDSREQLDNEDSGKLAGYVIIKDLNVADRNVQVQVLELMRARHIVTHSGVHSAPRNFIIVALLATDVLGPPFLSPHLNDHFFISHIHESSEAMTYTDGMERDDGVSISSQGSVIRPKPASQSEGSSRAVKPVITNTYLTHLRSLPSNVSTSAEIRRYMHNLVTFLRLHRAVAGGVSAVATRHLTLLSRLLAMTTRARVSVADDTHSILAPLHSVSFVTPSLIALAFRKVYAHRVEIARPEIERSLKWGSDMEAVRQALEGITPEVVIENILCQVEVPL